MEDVNHGDALFEKISSYQNGIIWVVTKDTYNEFFDKQGKAIDSGLTKEELERALTYMHCKYFQYLRFIQVPVVNTEEELNAVDRDYIYYRLYAKDWQKNIKIVPNVDGYPIDVEIFNQYYKLCKEVDDGLNTLISETLTIDTNTTVIDAILALNEYVINKTGYDYNFLKGSYSSSCIEYENGKYYIYTSNDKTQKSEITIDENGYIRIIITNSVKCPYIDVYYDKEGKRFVTHRIYDLRWLLKKSSDDRNPFIHGEEHHGVCASYAQLFSAVLAKCGYESTFVRTDGLRDGLSHGFNQITLDGKKYYCDITQGNNSKEKPTENLFMTFDDCKKSDMYENPKIEDYENGKIINIIDDKSYYYFTIDMCGGLIEMPIATALYGWSYYEFHVANDTYIKDILSGKKVSKAKYIFDGWYTSKSGGRKVNTEEKITGNMKIYAHWKKVKVQKGKIKKVTAKKKKLIIKYNSIEDVYSYTIQVSTKKTFKSKYTKNYSAKKENISKKVKVKKKGMYYVRIRGEKKDSFGNIIHGKWSAVKKVKVK